MGKDKLSPANPGELNEWVDELMGWAAELLVYYEKFSEEHGSPYLNEQHLFLRRICYEYDKEFRGKRSAYPVRAARP